MPFLVILEQILALFLILFFGFYLRSKNVITRKYQQFLFDLLIDYILPFLIISAMTVKINSELIDNAKILFICWTFVYLILMISANIFKRFIKANDRQKRTFEFLIIFSNVGYMGLPIIGSIYSETGIFYGSLGMIPFNIVIWTYGIYLLSSGKKENSDRLQNIINNGVIAIGIGFLLFITGIELPGPIFEAVEMIGDMTFPLSMLIIGSSLYGIDIKRVILKPKLIFLSLLRLLIIPVILLLTLNFLPIPDILVGIIVIQAAMPIAANSVIFAARYQGDYQLASEAVFITTLFGIISIPIIIWLINLI
ncbi:MAG: AEC family transporter [Bacillota bacterium]